MSQTSTRVGWNGGWAERQSRGFVAFALCPFGALRGVPLLRLTALERIVRHTSTDHAARGLGGLNLLLSQAIPQ